ncbi:MAG TPA: hypothetical protein VK994_00620, partial [Bacteroidales bacterium]|nr:hypothetical protein [Bacteroidales bacterium]
MKSNIIYTLIAFIAFGLSLHAQKLSNLRMRQVSLHSDTISLDTLSVVPGSMQLRDAGGKLIDTSLYTVDEVHALLIPGDAMRNDSSIVNISYRVFPFHFTQEYKHKDLSLLEP